MVLKWDIEAINSCVMKIYGTVSDLGLASDRLNRIEIEEFKGRLNTIASSINNATTDIMSIALEITNKISDVERADLLSKLIIEKLLGQLAALDIEDFKYLENVVELGTPAAILKYAKLLSENDDNFRWTGLGRQSWRLVYNSDNVDDYLYNEKGGTCCATSVFVVLALAGYLTPEEVLYNPNWQVNIKSALEAKEWEEIEDKSKVEAGDVITYYDKTGSYCRHIEIYGGDGFYYNWRCRSTYNGKWPFRQIAYAILFKGVYGKNI